jgi:hypothetical protein
VFEAKVILDSVCDGQRLTTMQVTHPRIVHAEFMTHCMFARNASSSRAIPFKKTVQWVMEDPFIPDHWGINQSGMQALAELTGLKRAKAVSKWLEARDQAVRIASEMASADKCSKCSGVGSYQPYRNLQGLTADEIRTELAASKTITCEDCGGDGLGLNVHKQIVNRLIEPWSWITVCVTGDASAWSNYFALRCHPDAQPDIQKQAYLAQKAYFDSTPQQLQPGEWHTPYIQGPREHTEILNWAIQNVPALSHRQTEFGFWTAEEEQLGWKSVVEISTGRCARTSYLTQEGTRDFGEDVKLHDRLRYHTPMHASPFEHVCMAVGNKERYAKYTGWKAYRHFISNEYITDFQPNHPELVVK